MKARKSNFELLRIISILLIIGYHFCSESKANIFQSNFSINQIWAFGIGSWGLVGVHCFFFISAYFLIMNNNIHFEKICKIIAQTLFYSCIAVFIVTVGNIYPMRLGEILYNCVAPLMGEYWFVSVYCIIYIISPFINIFLKNITEGQLKKCIIVLSIIVPGLLTIWGNSPCGTLGMAIYDYFLVAGLEKNVIHISKRKASIYSILTIFVILIAEVIGTMLCGRPIGIVRLTGRCSGFQVLLAFYIFIIFKNINIHRGNKIINWLSSNTLRVYLIHENPLLGAYIRDDLFKINKLYLLKMFPIYILLFIFITFLITTVIDKVRIVTVEKLVFSVGKKKIYWNKIDNWFNEI